MDQKPVDLTVQSTINFSRPTPPPAFDQRSSRNRTVPRKDITEWLVMHSGGLLSSTTHLVSVVAVLVFVVLVYLWWVIAHATPGPVQLPERLLPKTPSGTSGMNTQSPAGSPPSGSRLVQPPPLPRP